MLCRVVIFCHRLASESVLCYAYFYLPSAYFLPFVAAVSVRQGIAVLMELHIIVMSVVLKLAHRVQVM
jgi:hypothetical protein